jgi:ERCC4-related helicase
MLKLHGEIFPQKGSRLRKAEIPGFPKTVIERKLIPDAKGKAAKLCEEIRHLFEKRRKQASDAEERQSVLEMLIRRRQSLELLKVPELVDLAQDYAETSRVIIFVHYKDTIRALVDALPGFVPVIDGENSDEERWQIKKRFQANEFPVLVANAAAGGVGLGLEDPTGQVDRTVLISPGWSGPQLKQVFGRANRDGGGFSQQFLIGFADTLEEDILGCVCQKLDNLDLLNDAVMHGAI